MRYFTIGELTGSATARRLGIDNTADARAVAALTALVDNVLDPLRTAYGAPIRITSGYRSPRLNAAVGGAKSSHHLRGMAADITSVPCTRRDNSRLFSLILSLNLPFTQLIWERGSRGEGPDWVHVSYDPARLSRRIIYN